MNGGSRRIYGIVAVAVAVGVVFQFAVMTWGFFWYRAQQQAIFERELLNEGASALQPAATLMFLAVRNEVERQTELPSDARLERLKELLKGSSPLVMYDTSGRFIVGDDDLARLIAPGDLIAQVRQAQYNETREFEYNNFDRFSAHEVGRPVLVRFRYLPDLEVLVGYGTTFDTRSVRLALNAEWSFQQIVHLLGVIGGVILAVLGLGLLVLRRVVRGTTGGAPRNVPSVPGVVAAAVADADTAPAELAALRERLAAAQSELDSMQSDISYKAREQELELQAASRVALAAERASLVHRMRDALDGSVVEPLRRLADRVGESAPEVVASLQAWDILTGVAPVDYRPVDVAIQAWLDELVGGWGLSPAIQIENHTPATLVLQVDPQVAEECLRPVVQNAMDAAGEGGRIQIDAAQAAGCLELRITDDGPGMTPEERRLAGEPFYSTRAGHAGLGLARARALAARIGGSVEIYSERGRGTVAVLRLPLP